MHPFEVKENNGEKGRVWKYKVREERSGRICHQGSRGKVYRVCDFHVTLESVLLFFLPLCLPFFIPFFPFLLRVTLLASTLLFRIRIHFLVLPRAFSPLFPIVEGVYIMVYSVLFECNKCKEVLLVGRLKLIHSLRRNRRGEWFDNGNLLYRFFDNRCAWNKISSC